MEVIVGSVLSYALSLFNTFQACLVYLGLED